MLLWRISNYADLSGQGGLYASGRWHSRGRPILYAAEHPALCLLEMLVHTDYATLPTHYRLLGIQAPGAQVMDIPQPATLSASWASSVSESRAAGDAFLKSGQLLLRVPSAIMPHAWNVLINPAASEAALLHLASQEDVPVDPRLTS
jgi:RES domain-containing protein